MTPTDPTPDAIRAAIAEFLAWYVNHHHTLPSRRPDGVLDSAGIAADHLYNRLAQIGAVPAAGTVTISREDHVLSIAAAQMAATESLETCRRYNRKRQPNRTLANAYYEQSKQFQGLVERLKAAALANGADDGGA